jgi:hypothetical protein
MRLPLDVSIAQESHRQLRRDRLKFIIGVTLVSLAQFVASAMRHFYNTIDNDIGKGTDSQSPAKPRFSPSRAGLRPRVKLRIVNISHLS